MVFFNALYKGFVLFASIGILLTLLSMTIGLNIWLPQISSFPGFLIGYLFCVFIILSATYK